MIERSINHTRKRKEHTEFTWFGKLAYVHGKQTKLSFSPMWFGILQQLGERALTSLSLSPSVGFQITSIYNLRFLSPQESPGTKIIILLTLNLVIRQPNEPIRSTQNTRHKPNNYKHELGGHSNTTSFRKQTFDM